MRKIIVHEQKKKLDIFFAFEYCEIEPQEVEVRNPIKKFRREAQGKQEESVLQGEFEQSNWDKPEMAKSGD